MRCERIFTGLCLEFFRKCVKSETFLPPMLVYHFSSLSTNDTVKNSKTKKHNFQKCRAPNSVRTKFITESYMSIKLFMEKSKQKAYDNEKLSARI